MKTIFKIIPFFCFIFIVHAQSVDNETSYKTVKADFVSDEVTYPDYSLTHNQQYIIFNVLGDIYRVSINGGESELVYKDKYFKRHPKLSPDEKSLLYISDINGVEQAFLLDLKTKKSKEIPRVNQDEVHFESHWISDNKIAVVVLNRIDIYNFHTLELIESIDFKNKNIFINPYILKFDSNKKHFHLPFEESEEVKVFSYDIGDRSYYINKLPNELSTIPSRVYMTEDSSIVYIQQNSYNKNEKEEYKNRLKLHKNNKILTLEIIDDVYANNFIVFSQEKKVLTHKDGGFVIIDLENYTTYSLPLKIEVSKEIIKNVIPPIRINDECVKANIFRWPLLSENEETLFFTSLGKIFAKNNSDETRILIDEDEKLKISPTLSPCGNYLAYTTWNDKNLGHLIVRDLSGNKEYVLTEKPGKYINPEWSPSGNSLLFISDISYDQQIKGSVINNYHLEINEIKWSQSFEDITQRKVTTVLPMTVSPNRFYPTMTYHTDGESFYTGIRTEEGQTVPIIAEINLKTGDKNTICTLPFNIDEVKVSPDNTKVLLIYDDTLVLSIFPYYTPKEVDEFNLIDIETIAIYDEFPIYASWVDVNKIIWSSANEIWQYSLNDKSKKRIEELDVCYEKPRIDSKIALVNTKVVTMDSDDKIIENGLILIEGNRIKFVGNNSQKKVPDDYFIIDLEGKTTTPGFIDTHFHFTIPNDSEILHSSKNLFFSNIAFGVTTIYNPSTKTHDFNEYQLMLNTGIIPGPRLYHSGNIIMEEVFSRYYATKEVYSEKDAVRVLDNLHKYGINMPIKEYGNPNRKRREWLSKAAIDIGIPITSHEGGTLKVLQNNITRIIDGYSSLEHWISHGKVYNDVILFLAKSEVNFTPTLMVSPGGLQKLIFNNTDFESLTKLKNIDKEYYKKIIIELTHYKDNEDYFSEAIDEKMVLNLMTQHGVNLSIGGHGNPIPGLSTIGEIWAFAEAGVSNYDALRVATINGAIKLNLQEELGSIETGKLADLNIFDECPLLDIKSLNDLGFTIINGQIYDVKSMKLIN